MTAPARLRSPRRGTGSATGAGSTVAAGAVRAPATSSAAPAFALPGVQRKMAVGKADSTWEREADGVADKVMQGAPAPAISALPAGGLGATAQRKDSKGDSKVEETDKVQAKAGQEEGMEDDTVQRKDVAKDEEVDESVQKKDTGREEEADESVQKKDAGREEEVDDAVQKKEAGEEEEEPVQARASGRQAHERAAAEAALRHPGPGAALPGEQRGKIERATGADLSDVRVHDDASAARAAEGIGARAFTHGRDIWLGPGESARDTALMAHEAAHVVQQTGRHAASGRGTAGPAPTQATAGTAAAMAGGGGAPPRLVQREENDNAGDPPGVSTANGSTLDVPAGTLEIPTLDLPTIAGGDQVIFPAKASKPGERDTNQRLYWLQQMQIDETGVQAATPDDKAVDLAPGGKSWFMRLANSKNFAVGSRESLRTATRLPNWKNNGVIQNFQVDHVVEDQLGGADTLTNYQLLDPETNRAKGNAIRQSIKNAIDDAMDAHEKKHPKPKKGEPDAYEAIRSKSADKIRTLLEVTFKQKGKSISVNAPNQIWPQDKVKAGEHLKALTPTNDTSIIPPSGTEMQLVILPGESGGAPMKFDIKDGKPAMKSGPFFGGINNLVLIEPVYSPGSLELKSKFIVKGKVVEDINAPLKLTSIGNPYTFQMPSDLMQQGLEKRLNMPKASPVTVTTAAISGGQLEIKARVDFSSKLFKGASANVSIHGEDVELTKTFEGGEFAIPGPIDIKGSSLTIGIGIGGGQPNLSVEGEVNFEVQRVGNGILRGRGELVDGVSVAGEFDFDPALFKGADARIKIAYANDRFTGEGTLKIGEGQFKGIKSAELMVKVEDDKWEATGTVVPKIPGVSQGTMSMKFDPAGGFEIAGELTLGEGIPRLKGGKLNAKLAKEGEAWKVAASGEAELDIPGVASKLAASYDDGKFKAEVTAAYARGIASGSVTVGATNMPVDPETGAFTEGEPAEAITIFGSGALSIQFTPWLKGTAGVVVKPDGKMEVKGKVELPSSLEVFPEKKLEKQLISLGVDIPVFGVAAAGQRIGIFLNISGGLTAKASIGPGELKDVAVEVAFDPEDMSTAKVTGTARFAVPAKAGLRLTVQGAIGAGIPIVSARAGLELGAELGIVGEAYADAQVEWTPAKGLSLEADVGVKASPQFTFDVTGFVDVTADLVLTEIELYSKRWQLASFKYGSGMEVGANLKVKMENNEIKPITMDDVTITKPDIDPVALAKGVIAQVV